MQNKIILSAGKLAIDEAALKAKRDAFKQRLLQDSKVSFKIDGKVSESVDGLGICIPTGKVSPMEPKMDEATLKAKRMAIKQRLLQDSKVSIKPDEKVSESGDELGFSIPLCKDPIEPRMEEAFLKKKERLLSKVYFKVKR